MEHGFTWYNLLPHEACSSSPEHTFFAIASILVGYRLCLVCAHVALLRAQDPTVPEEKLGARNIAELLLEYVVVSQSDAIIGKAGRKYVPYFASFFFFILFSNLMGLLPGFVPPTGNLNTTLGLALGLFHWLQRDRRARAGNELFQALHGPYDQSARRADSFQSWHSCRCCLFQSCFF